MNLSAMFCCLKSITATSSTQIMMTSNRFYLTLNLFSRLCITCICSANTSTYPVSHQCLAALRRHHGVIDIKSLLPFETHSLPPMAFRSIFSVNGVNVNARLDPLRETSSISSSFRNLACVAYDLDALISVPLGPSGSGFTCQLRLGDGQHTEDLVLGKDWLALYRQHALYPTARRNIFHMPDDHRSQNMGLQYSSRDPLPRVIEAQASDTSTSTLSSL